MKLFIIKDILIDHSGGMVIVAANNHAECREVFLKEFVDENPDYETEFDSAPIQVIESVGIDEPCVVSYIYGGS
jgi:hypothetical protein